MTPMPLLPRLTPLLALLLMGASMAQAAATVTGTVKDSITSAVLSGVVVKVDQQSSKTATTNASGVFSITSVAAGTVTVTATKAGYVTKTSGNVVVPASGTVTVPPMLMAPLGTVTGRIVNATGGAVVSGALITVTGTSTTATSTSTGTFSLQISSGTYTLTITKTGWVTKVTPSIVVTPGVTFPQNDIPIVQNGTLSGKTVNLIGSAAVGSCTVAVNGTTVTGTSNATTGVFSALSVAPGSYTLTVSKTGWLPKTTASYTVTAGTNTATGDIGISQGAIAGTVTNAAGGAVIAGATVTQTGTSNATTTAADGTFNLPQNSGTVTLTVAKAGFQNKVTGSIVVTAGATNSGNAIQLSASTSVSGVVKEQGTNALLASATVTLHGTPANTTTTAADGTFTLNNVPTGSQTFDVSKTGYTSLTTAAFTVVSGANTLPTVFLTKQVGTINGKITDAQNGGANLPGVTVTVNGVTPVISATTDASGNYSLTGVPIGTRTLAITAAGYVTAASGNLTVTNGGTTNAPPQALTRTTVTVSGTVRDSVSNAVINGATLTIQQQAGISATSNASGAYSLAGVYWGNVTLVSAASGYANQAAPVTLVAGTNATQNILMGSSSGTLTGTIADLGTTFGLEGVDVALTSNPGISAVTDLNGAYTLTSVPIGSQTVTATRGGYTTGVSGAVTASSGATTPVPQLKLAPQTCTVRARVVDPWNGNSPLAGVTVTAARGGQTTTTDVDGNYVLSGLAPGVEYLSLTKAGYTPGATPALLLDPGDDSQINDEALRPVPPGSEPGVIHGKVTDSLGAAVAGATVTLVGGSSTTTAADGSYTFTKDRGRYLVRVTKAGSATVVTGRFGTFEQAAGTWQIQADVTLPAAGATGTVTVTTINPVTRVAGPGVVGLRNATGSYRVVTSASGMRSLALPAGPVVAFLDYVKTVPAGGTLAVSADGNATVTATAPKWSAAGLVFKELSGNPVVGANVTFTNGAFSNTVATDANGRFTFSSGPVGEYAVTVAGAGVTPPENPWTFDAQDDDGYRGVDFRLEVPAENGSVAITSPLANASLPSGAFTLDAVATLPVAGDFVEAVDVELSNGPVNGRLVTYALDGRSFAIAVDSAPSNGPGTITVTVFTRNGKTLTRSVDVNFAQSLTPASVTLNPSAVPGGATATGTVVLNLPAPADTPVALSSTDTAKATVQASVTVPSGQTSADFPVSTALRGSSTPVNIQATLNSVTKSATLTISASTTGAISGTVVDSQTGFGLNGSVSVVGRPDLNAYPDLTGAFSIAGVPVGSQQLVVHSNNYTDKTTAALNVLAGATIVAGTIALDPIPASFTGRAIDPWNGGAPLEGITVTAARTGQTTTTAADGTFTVAGLLPGVEHLAFQKTGYTAWTSRELFVNPGQVDAHVDDALLRPLVAGTEQGIAHGTLRDAAGNPLAGVTVRAVGQAPTALTAANGTYTLALPRGVYTIVAEKAGYQTATSRQQGSFETATSWRILQDFTLQTSSAAGTLAVTTYDPVTRAASPGEAYFYLPQGRYVVYETGTPRSFPVAAGPVFVTDRWVPSVAPSGTLTVMVPGSATNPATSPHWTAAGIVYKDTDGTPLGGATVTLTNAAASFTTTVTTDAYGRYAFSSGPVGGYAVTYSAPGFESTAAEPWTFNAQDDANGVLYANNLFLRAVDQDGTLTVTSPVDGATLNADPTSVVLTTVLPRPADYVDAVYVSLSNGTVTSLVPTYALDGRGVTVALATSSLPNGQTTTLHVVVVTRYAVLTQDVTVTIQKGPALSTFTVSPASVTGGTGATGTVTLSAAALAGGLTVSLSSDTNAAQMPASVTVPEGATTAPVAITTAPVGISTAAHLSATLNATTRTATLTVAPAQLQSVSVSPASVLGGTSATGTVTLTSAAPYGGLAVALATNNAGVTVPASVTVSEGGTAATFGVTTTPVGSPATVVLTATLNAASVTANLSVGPLAVTGVSLNPTTVGNGATSTGTVTLNGPATAGGIAVTLSSGSPTVATVPATVNVAQGQTTATFAVTAQTVATQQTAVITATYGSSSANATLTVAPPALTSLAINPASVRGGGSATGTVTLNAAAGASGIVVTLTSLNPPLVAVPATVTVVQGQTTATFAIATQTVVGPTAVTVRASYSGVDKDAVITLTTDVPAGELTENNAAGWGAFASDSAAASVTDEVSLVKVGTKAIKLTSASAADSGLRYPATGTLNWDLSTKSFLTFWAYAQTGTFTNAQPVVVLKSAAGSLTITPPSALVTVGAWRLYQIPLVGFGQWARSTIGSFDIGNVTQFEIHHHATAGFAVVYDGLEFVENLPGDLAEGNAQQWSGASVDGKATSVFDDASLVKSGSSSVRLVATSGADTFIRFPADGDAHWDLSAADHLTFLAYATSPSAFEGIGPTIVLNTTGGSIAYTPVQQLLVRGAWQLLEVALAGGAGTGWSRSVNGTASLADVTSIEIWANSSGFGYLLNLDGVTFGQPVATFAVTPKIIAGGTSATGTVTLPAPAPAGGVLVTLSSAQPADASVPPTVTIPQGQMSATFPIATSVRSAASLSATTTISATYSGRTWTANVASVATSQVTAVSVSPEIVIAGTSATGTVTIAAPAPAGGQSVGLSKSTEPGTPLGVPATIIVPEGATLATFTVTTSPVTQTNGASIMAVSNAGFSSPSVRYAPFLVKPNGNADLYGMSTSPFAVMPGDGATGTVTLTQAAPAGGLTVSLSTSDTSVATVPASITVSQGQSSATFPIVTSAAASGRSATVIATAGGLTVTSMMTVIGVFAIEPAASSGPCTQTLVAVPGYPCAIKVRLNAIPPVPVTVTLTSSDPATASLPATVIVGTGTNQATATVGIPPSIAEAVVVTITASALQASKTAQLTVEPFGVRSVTLSKTSENGGEKWIGCWVELNSPAPAGGSAIGLTYTGGLRRMFFDTYGFAHFSTTGTATVPAGQTGVGLPDSVTYQVPVTTSSTVTATLGASSKTATMTVNPAPLTLLALNPPSAGRGSTVNVDLAFDGVPTFMGRALPTVPAVQGDAVLFASSNPAVLAVPASAEPRTLPDANGLMSNRSHYGFPFTIPTNALDGTVTLTASYGGVSKTATFTVAPTQLTGLTVTPTIFPSGVSATATLTLNSPAPPGGLALTITNPNPSALTAPATVTVPAGASSATFTITAQSVASTVQLTLTATDGSNPKSVPLTILRPGAAIVTGTVYDATVVDRDLGAFGTSVAVTGEGPSATVDSTGAFSFYHDPGTFTLTVSGGGWTSQTTSSLTASTGATVNAGTLQLRRTTSAGAGFRGKVLDAANAPVAGATVTVQGFDDSVLKDASGVYTLGPDRKVYRVTVNKAGYPAETEDVYQDIAFGSPVDLGTLRLDGVGTPAVTSATLSPTTIAGGQSSTLTVQLAAGTTTGMKVATSFSDPAATNTFGVFNVPSQPVGTPVTFTSNIVGLAVAAPAQQTITVYAGGQRRAATVTVNPTGGAVVPQTVVFSPATVTGGSTSTATITLSAAAPAGGAVVSLTAVNATVLPTVTVAQGQTSATVVVTATPVAITTNATVTANYNAASATGTLVVNPPSVAGISLNPTTVTGGTSATATVTLDAAAPTGGTTLALTTSNTSVATVPSSVVVSAGQTTATFTVTTLTVASPQTVAVSATLGLTTRSTNLTVNPVSATITLSGLAPGIALPGATSLVAYGTGYTAQSTEAVLSGPVYTLQNSAQALCNIGGVIPPVCADQFLTALPNVSSGTVSFSLPPGTASGVYYVRVKTGTTWSTNGKSLVVEEAQKTYPVVTPEAHKYATRIEPGQTVTGTLAGNQPNAPEGVYDFNQYYFFGTAGSHIRVSMERVDTSKPWEHPDSLDPQLSVIAPDGFVYENLAKTDNRDSIDLNATLTDAVLPLTGLYFISAETTRGSGAYRLSFDVLSVVPPTDRLISITPPSTLPLNVNARAWTAMLDSRGYPISGAEIGWTLNNTPDDHGALQFNPDNDVQTSSLGLAMASFRMTSAGKLQLTPTFTNAQLNSVLSIPASSATTGSSALPRYRPIAQRSVGVVDVSEDGSLGLASVRGINVVTAPVPTATLRQGKGEEPQASISSREPKSLPELPAAQQRQALLAASCAPAGKLQLAGVINTPATPLSVTVTDLTGGAAVGPDGVVGYRIEKTVRLKLDVKDANNQTPTYPVLVHLQVGGPRHGTLILDPDGAATECHEATFLWHESDLKPNDTFEYRLGTFAGLSTVVPDPQAPGTVKPFWAAVERLDISITAPNATQVSELFEKSIAVRPEPGKPDHIADNGLPNPIPFWSGYMNGATITNVYLLKDQYENNLWGYTNVAVTPLAGNLPFTFWSQAQSGPNWLGYAFQMVWGSSMPTGSRTSTLTLTYAATPDWAGGTLTKEMSFQLDAAQRLALTKRAQYDRTKPDGTLYVDDGTFPMSVSPGATTAALPVAEDGTAKRLVLLLVTATKVPGTTPADGPEPFPNGHLAWAKDANQVWQSSTLVNPDPALNITTEARLKLTLIDQNGAPVPEGSFRVHRCPRFDHDSPAPPDQEGRPCDIAPVDSTGGVVSQVAMNPADQSSDLRRGYLAIELLQAPVNPGTYFVDVESLDGNVRIRNQGDLWTDLTPAGEFQGAFALCTVGGGEFLDRNFQPIDPYVVDEPTTAYYRYVATAAGPQNLSLAIESRLEGGVTATDTVALQLNKLAQSNAYLTPPFSLLPPAPSAGPVAAPAFASGGTLLVAAPVSDLIPAVSGSALPKGRAIAGDIKILTERRYVGNGRGVATWATIDAADVAYLGDDLRLTAQPPQGWTATPLAYQWRLAIDGKPYVPPCNPPAACADLTQSTVLLSPLQKAGRLDATVEITYSNGVKKTGRTSRPIWLETAATTILGWIDADQIDLGSLFPGSPFLGPCTELAADIAIWSAGVSYNPPSIYFPADANAALLKFGAIPAPPTRFDTEDDVRVFITQRVAAHKAALAAQYRIPVVNGSILTTSGGSLLEGRTFIQLNRTGATEIRLPCLPPNSFTWGGEEHLNNGRISRLSTASGINGFSLLTKGRIGLPGQRVFDSVNSCSGCTPWIWMKAVFTMDSPYPRTDWVNWRTAFPTMWLYYAQNAADGGRNYPIVVTEINRQVANPNVFLLNPDQD